MGNFVGYVFIPRAAIIVTMEVQPEAVLARLYELLDDAIT
jgi:hypothetical protein